MAADYRFSRGEEQVLAAALEGLTDAEISERMGVGAGTVRTYWKRIRTKTGGATRTEVLATVRAAADGAGSDDRLLRELVLRRTAEERASAWRRAFVEAAGRLAAPAWIDGDPGGWENHEAASVPRRKPDFAEAIAGEQVGVCDPPSGSATIFAAAFAVMRVPAAIVDREGRIFDANPRFAEFLGSDCRGESFRQRVALQDRTIWDQLLSKAVMGKDCAAALKLLPDAGSQLVAFVDLAQIDEQRLVLTARRLAR